jgi:DinB superfamily
MTHLDAAHTLRQLIDEYERKFLAVSEAAAAHSPSPEKWSRKQILGHLIDSAANNHQRFIRLQLAPELQFPGYQQNEWVTLNGYSSRSWSELVALWAGYNRHLAHVIEHLDPAALPHIWDTGNHRYTLEFIATDYVDHLRHHLAQIADPTRS